MPENQSPRQIDPASLDDYLEVQSKAVFHRCGPDKPARLTGGQTSTGVSYPVRAYPGDPCAAVLRGMHPETHSGASAIMPKLNLPWIAAVEIPL